MALTSIADQDMLFTRDARRFPFTIKTSDLTFHVGREGDTRTLALIDDLFRQREVGERLACRLEGRTQHTFLKLTGLRNLKTRMRLSLGYTRTDGGLEWPLAELLNTSEANRRQAPVPTLYGYGYRRSRYGLIQDVFLVSEWLEGYLSGEQWLQAYPGRVEELLQRVFALMRTLHDKQVAHLDLWLGNVMLDPGHPVQAKVVDLENAYIGPVAHFAEVLAFQFGFLYYRRVRECLDEARYDALVEQALLAYPQLDRQRFAAIYVQAKHQHVGRKQRRLLVTHGRFVAD